MTVSGKGMGRLVCLGGPGGDRSGQQGTGKTNNSGRF